ncbi:hypothetical protein D3C71_1045260 [compost metagenome]
MCLGVAIGKGGKRRAQFLQPFRLILARQDGEHFLDLVQQRRLGRGGRRIGEIEINRERGREGVFGTMLATRERVLFFRMLRAERQHIRSQAGGVVGDAKTTQICLSSSGKVGIHLDGRINLLALLRGHGNEGGGGVELRLQLQLAVSAFLRSHGQHVALRLEGAIGQRAAKMFDPDTRAEGRAVVGSGDLFQPFARDSALIGSLPFGGDGEPFLGHVVFSQVRGTGYGVRFRCCHVGPLPPAAQSVAVVAERRTTSTFARAWECRARWRLCWK